MDHKPYAKALEPITTRVRTDITGFKSDDKMIWTKQSLTPARMIAHLDGRGARGCCPIKAGENTTEIAVLDFDSHAGETSQGDMMRAAKAVSDRLFAEGIYAIAFRSSGGRGIHLYMLWQGAQDAYSVRCALRAALADTGFKNGTGGVAKGEIEIFPKQDFVPHDGNGSYFVLPLAGKSEPLDLETGLEMGRDAVLAMAWPVSHPVRRVERPVPAPARAPEGALAEWVPYLYAIDPNLLNYEQWLEKVGFALHYETEGSDEGFDLWDAWSSQSGKYGTLEYNRFKWDSIKNDKSNNVTGNTLIGLAREYGYNADFADDFEIVAVADDVPVPRGGEMVAAVGKARGPQPNFKRNKNGEIEAVIENLTKAIERGDFMGFYLGYDTFKDQMSIATAPGAWQEFRDTDYTRIQLALEKSGFRPVGRQLLRDTVIATAEANQFDSGVVWLETIVPAWDGVPRIATFCRDYLSAEDTPYTSNVGLYMWTAMAGRILQPGCKADMMPILIGAQGCGKSTSIKALAPATELYIALSLSRKDDDLARLMRGVVVVEIAELHGLRTKEIENIKAFLTATEDTWVPKFRESMHTNRRRCIFIGTTNTDEFLDDDTGNRRFLPLPVGQCHPARIIEDREQLWAEARELFKAGGVNFAAAQKLATDEHVKYMVSDVWEEDVVRFLTETDLDGTCPGDQEYVRLSDILRATKGGNLVEVTRQEQLRLGKILKKMGYVKADKRVEGRVVKVWAKICSPCDLV